MEEKKSNFLFQVKARHIVLVEEAFLTIVFPRAILWGGEATITLAWTLKILEGDCESTAHCLRESPTRFQTC